MLNDQPGTDLSESSIHKSNQYAAALAEPPREFTLYPRTTGWNHIISLVQHEVSHVFDFTIFYVDYELGERPSEMTFLRGRFPLEICIFIQRYPAEVCRRDPGRWLEQRFAEKEELLKTFYQDSHLPRNLHELWTTYDPEYWRCLLFWGVLSSLFCFLVWSSPLFWLYLVAVIVLYRVYFNESNRLDSWIHKRCGNRAIET